MGFWGRKQSQGAIEESFEDQDITDFSGETSYYSVSSNDSVDGTESLLITGTTNSRAILHDSISLEYDTLQRFWFNATKADTFSSLAFHGSFGGTQTASDVTCYAVEYDAGTTDEFRLRLVENGTYTTLAANSITEIVGRWFAVDVEHKSSGVIEATLYDTDGSTVRSSFTHDTTSDGQTTLSPSDGTYGFLTNLTTSTHEVYYDHLTAGGDTGTYIDSFEDSDLTEYTAVNGSKTNWSFINSPTVHGNKAIETDTGATRYDILSESGLDYYPSRGDIVRLDYAPINGGEYGLFFFFLTNNADDSYYLQMSPDSDSVELHVVDGGTDTQLGSAIISWTFLEYHAIYIDTSDTGTNSIDVEVRKDGTTLGSITTTDSTHDSGGIQIGHNGVNSADQSRFDNIKEIERR